jgi:hypothetical protein
VATGIPARLPIATYGVGLLALLRQSYGSFAVAGLAVAAYTGAAVGSSFFLGRRADRAGYTRLLVGLALADGFLMVTLLVAVRAHLGLAGVTGLALALGAALPPAGVVVRSRWAVLVEDPDALAGAMFLESALDEGVFVLGPVLMSVVGATAGPAAALVTAAVCTTAGILCLATVPYRVRIGATPNAGHRRPYRLYAGFLGTGVAFAAVQVGTFACTRQIGTPAASGVVLGWFSIVSLVAGLVLGRRTSRPPFHAGLAALGVALLLPAWAPTSVSGLAGFVVPAALAASATVALGYGQVSQMVPAEGRASAYAWAGAALGAGLALGSAVAGLAVEITDTAASAFLTGAVTALAAAAVARERRPAVSDRLAATRATEQHCVNALGDGSSRT